MRDAMRGDDMTIDHEMVVYEEEFLEKMSAELARELMDEGVTGWMIEACEAEKRRPRITFNND